METRRIEGHKMGGFEAPSRWGWSEEEWRRFLNYEVGVRQGTGKTGQAWRGKKKANRGDHGGFIFSGGMVNFWHGIGLRFNLQADETKKKTGREVG